LKRTPLPPGINPADRIVLFDGVCNLCNAGVRFIIAHDPKAKLRLASLQSPAGQTLLAWTGLPTSHFDTMVFIENGQAFVQSTAILRIARHLRWPWPLFSIALAIPAFLRDGLYDSIARYRYRLFGKRDTCMVPTPELKRRFLE
jgi:predicted DCC family thiol-disulfide oxidoreductase YuxK